MGAEEELIKTLRESLKTACECIDALASFVLEHDKRLRDLELKLAAEA